MKKDLIFIVIVLISGFIGLVYTNRSTDDLLVEKHNEMVEQNGDAARVESRAYDSFRIKNTTPQIGASLPKGVSISEDYERYQAQLDANKDSEQFDSNTFDPLLAANSWEAVFDAWKLSVIENMTPKSNLVDSRSEQDCVVDFYIDGDTPTSLDFSHAVSFSVAEDALGLEQGESRVILNYLRSGISLRVATRKLTEFCQ